MKRLILKDLTYHLYLKQIKYKSDSYHRLDYSLLLKLKKEGLAYELIMHLIFLNAY